MAIARPPQLPVAPREMQHEIEHDGLTWIDIRYPTDDQLAYLQARFHFHPLHMEDVRAQSSTMLATSIISSWCCIFRSTAICIGFR